MVCSAQPQVRRRVGARAAGLHDSETLEQRQGVIDNGREVGGRGARLIGWWEERKSLHRR